jgi:hypothetical protein
MKNLIQCKKYLLNKNKTIIQCIDCNNILIEKKKIIIKPFFYNNKYYCIECFTKLLPIHINFD